MPETVKKKFRISLKVRKCDVVFKEGLEPGVLGFNEHVFDLTEKDFGSPLFIKTLLDLRTSLLDDCVYTEVEEVKD